MDNSTMLNIIADIADLPVEEVKESSLLEDDLKMDSLMLLDLVIKLEQLTKRKILPEEMVTIKTVKNIIDFVAVG